jgi:hypothetical protein
MGKIYQKYLLGVDEDPDPVYNSVKLASMGLLGISMK